MRIADMRSMDVANGPGIRVSLYVQGCSHHCKGCFNPESWSFDGGIKWVPRMQEQFLKLGERKHIKGYSILGGEPLDQGKEMLELVQYLKQNSDKSIWMWTGYLYEDLNELQKEIVSYVDILVDGPFVEEQKNLKLKFKGSENQRVISIQSVTKCGIINSIKEEDL